MATVSASAGDRSTLDRALRLLGHLEMNVADARNAVPLVVVRAAQAIVHHDEPAARELIDKVVADHPLSNRLADVYLRRFLAVPFVCSAAARRHWEDDDLGPAHKLQRDVARAFIAGRNGELTATSSVPPPPHVYTALPLPWSVELAARAHAVRHPAGQTIAQWLVDRHGPMIQAELRRLTATETPAVADAAERLLTSLLVPPIRTTRVELAGPLRLLIDGEVVDRPEQRRARVREMLAILAVVGSVGRERMMDLLWPELRPVDAARNLRVTLTHLRRLLEPERSRGDPGYHLRVERERLRLVGSDRLEVDLWEIRHHLQGAATADATGDVAAQKEHLAAAAERWRGDPLRDLERIPELRNEVEHLRVGLMDAALSLGELGLAEGDTATTLGCAERVLAADPFAERALRLLVAAHLQRGDRVQTRSAVARTVAAFDELGLAPEPATSILLRHAGTARQGSP